MFYDTGFYVFGLIILGIVVVCVALSQHKTTEGRRIVRQRQRQFFRDVYEDSRAARTQARMEQRAHRAPTHIGSWTPENGNPVGYFGSLLWMRLRQNSRR